MQITERQIRAYRLGVHHLAEKTSPEDFLQAAGVCGLQNTPPGAWYTAMYNRVRGCTPAMLDHALYQEKSLLQAWSFRGAPVIFPTQLRDVFLTALTAQPDEHPWIYTLGLSGALAHLHMPFDELFIHTQHAAKYLDSHTIKSKDALDKTLANNIKRTLPPDKQILWQAPSIYGHPDKQTMGEAAVSFMLRPCSFSSLVVFAQRDGNTPAFTSFTNWIAQPPAPIPDAQKMLVQKFLHAYGPATIADFSSWLGCTKNQANRLWSMIIDETVPVLVSGKIRYMLADDLAHLQAAQDPGDALLLLGPHDPYLDIRDRYVILPDVARQKNVWKYTANPGAVVKGGKIIGVWNAKKAKEKLDISITLWENANQATLTTLAEQYAYFHCLTLQSCTYR